MKKYAQLLVVSLIFGPGGTTLASEHLPGSFVDDDDNVHEGNIEAIAAEAITRGCNPPANHYFCPDDRVTRGEMAAFLNRAFEYPSSEQDRFVDGDGTACESLAGSAGS